MAISFVAAGTIGQGTNPTAGVPTGYSAGDLFIFIVSGGNSIATPTGYTALASFSTSPRVFLFYKIATSSESSVTISAGGGTATSVILDYSGTSGIDVLGTFANATAVTTLATNTLITTVANDFVISVYTANAVAGTWSAITGTTVRVNSAATGSFTGLYIADELQASSGTTTARTGRISTSHSLTSYAFSIKPTGGVATTNGKYFLMF